jgi:hypothetical protein
MMIKNRLKGIAMMLVLFTIMIVIVFANGLLVVITNQARLTHHKVSRIQAFYAAEAGVNYAIEQLYTGAWTVNSCPGAGGCILSDPDFPISIVGQQVRIVVIPKGTAGCVNPPSGAFACLRVSATYTYTAPP